MYTDPQVGADNLQPFKVLILVPLYWLVACAPAPMGDVLADMDTAAPSNPLIVALVDLYEREGAKRAVFLSIADGATTTDSLEDLIAELSELLSVSVLDESLADRSPRSDVPFLTPIDPATGDLGVSLSIREVSVSGDNHRQVKLSFARSGLDAGIYLYTLQSDGNIWRIIDVALIGLS